MTTAEFPLHVVFIGDVVGRPGEEAVQTGIERLRRQLPVDVVIANGENAAGGKGLNEKSYNALRDAGVDVITLGNHAWDKREIFDFIDHADRVVRPANYPAGTPGRGWTTIEVAGRDIVVFQLLGRAFLNIGDCPFQVAEREIPRIRQISPVVILDMHAEATSEKMAMAHLLDGKVSAVLGTHTHVPTADERVLRGGTAFQTDLGMTGPHDSVIGRDTAAVLKHFTTGVHVPFDMGSGGEAVQGALVEVDLARGLARSIERINLPARVPQR